MTPTRLILAAAITAAVATVAIAQTKPAAPAKPAATAPAAKDKVIVDAATEKLLKGAVKYLAGQQTPAGNWAARGGEHPIAMTGYTLMALLSCGQLPGEGEYGKNVTAGANYLLSCVRDDGFITSEGARNGRKASNMYDHGVATIALAEIYGQTQDPEIKKKLELSVKLICSAQGPEGGWRYAPKPTQGDISVTVLQAVALRASKNAGILVPQPTIDKAVAFIKSCYDKNSGGFCYQPHSGPGFARTAAATYSLQVCGLYDDDEVASGSKYLFAHTTDKQYWTYGNFYAAPAQYMIGGKTWEDWYAAIHAILVPKAVSQGDITYWPAPIEGDGMGLGPVYCTAVYTMMLAMPYHYVPLYQR